MVKKEKNYGMNFEARHENRSNSREGVSEKLVILPLIMILKIPY